MTYTIQMATYGKSDWEYLDTARSLAEARTVCVNYIRSNHLSPAFTSFMATEDDSGEQAIMAGQLDEWRVSGF